MSSKPYDVLWPVTQRTVEDINANFDALWKRLTDVDAIVGEGGSFHDVLSDRHRDTEEAAVQLGDVIAGQGGPVEWKRLAAGTEGYVLRMGATVPAWASPNHNLLSAIHADSTIAAAVRGDLIVAQGVSPLWTRLAKGTAAYVLTMGADEPAWAALPSQTSALLSTTHTDTTPAAVVRGDLIAGIGATPKWERVAAGSVTYVLTMGATEPGWAAPASQTSALLSATHTDTTPSAVARGDVIVGSTATPKWTALTKGTAGFVLTMGADEPAWATPAAPAAHQLDGALHSVSGLTTGHFLKATGATTFAFAVHGLGYGDVGAAAASHGHAWADVSKTGSNLTDLATRQHAGLTDVTANQHHAQAHVLDGADHSVSGLSAGHFLKALSATTFGFAAHGLSYSDVGALAVGGTAADSDKLDGQHGSYYALAGAPPAAHQLDGALHSVSGLTTGHFLKATGATTFAFGAHGLGYGDVGAAAASHGHAWADVSKTGSSLADLATRAVANLSDGGNVALLNAANPFTAQQTSSSAAGLDTAAIAWEGWFANANWPITLAGIYDANYVDQFITFNGRLGGTFAASTLTNPSGNYAGWVRFASASGTLSYATRTGATGAPTTLVSILGSGAISLASTLAWGGGAAISDSSNVALLNAANSFSLINPLTTIAESWIGPSSTAGIYFHGGGVGIGVTPAAKFHVDGNSLFVGVVGAWSEGLCIDSVNGIWGGLKIRTVGRTGHSGNWHIGYNDVHGGTTGSDSNLYVYTSGTGQYVMTFQENGIIQIPGLGAFAAGDKYVIADASGNLHLSALGPAS